MRPQHGGQGGALELRCHCRRLLARVDGRRVLLKCPRCKAVAVLELPARQDSGRELTVRFELPGEGESRTPMHKQPEARDPRVLSPEADEARGPDDGILDDEP